MVNILYLVVVQMSLFSIVLYSQHRRQTLTCYDVHVVYNKHGNTCTFFGIVVAIEIISIVVVLVREKREKL